MTTTLTYMYTHLYILECMYTHEKVHEKSLPTLIPTSVVEERRVERCAHAAVKVSIVDETTRMVSAGNETTGRVPQGITQLGGFLQGMG